MTSDERSDRIESTLDRLEGVVHALSCSVVKHDKQIAELVKATDQQAHGTTIDKR